MGPQVLIGLSLGAACCPPLSLPRQAGGGVAHFPMALRWPRLLGFLKEKSTNEGCSCGQGQVLAPGHPTSCQAVAA